MNAALEIELFELLACGSKTSKEIAESLKTDEPITEALLNVLVAIGLLDLNDGQYCLTAFSQDYMLKSSEANQITAIQSFSGSLGPFDNLVQALTSGPTRFNNKMWTTEQAVLNMEQSAKAGMIQNVVSFITALPEFAACRKMCDLAGNIGYYSFALLNENNNLRAHVYDLLEVCELAERLKGKEPNLNRVNFHAYDIESGDSFGCGYDLFFCSHFLYEYGATRDLTGFLKTVNQSMKIGGVFVSNHISSNISGENYLTLTIVELMTRLMGYPTHQLPEKVLKEALSEVGFGDFTVRQPSEKTAFPTLLLSAVKLKEA
nr:methyltransferase dimerization domain-containing protein [Chloroherpeton thalassium]